MDFKRTLVDGTMTISLNGELDEKSARETREYLDEAIRRYRFDRLILNFDGVDFMDSTGIGVLLGRYNLLKSEGAEFCVTKLNPQIDKVFRVSGLYQIIKAV